MCSKARSVDIRGEETCVGEMWLRGRAEGRGERTHDNLFFCETRCVHQEEQCDDHQKGALRTNLGFIMKKNCAKLDSGLTLV